MKSKLISHRGGPARTTEGLALAGAETGAASGAIRKSLVSRMQ